jgi:hypothetical protein
MKLKAKPGCCEEASMLSGNFYIPCNAPATCVVGWKGRNEKPIRMCEMCADHNLRHRGGEKLYEFTLAGRGEAGQDAAGSGSAG